MCTSAVAARRRASSRRCAGRAKRERAQVAADAQAPLAWEGEAPEEAVHVLAAPAIEETLGAALGVAPAVAPPRTAQVRELPYAQEHGWEASRYAGVFPILLVLVSQWRGWRVCCGCSTRVGACSWCSR
jgi:hypothetical protein